MFTATARATADTRPSVSAGLRKVQRWIAVGGRAGARRRMDAGMSRRSSAIILRSWLGIVTPRDAAIASPISSGSKNASAERYTVSGSERSDSARSMLARSTERRHREGRTWQKKTSIGITSEPRTNRFAGLISRWAIPASHSERMRRSPLRITGSSTSATLSSAAPSMNPHTRRYSRSGEISANPNGSAVVTPWSRR